MRKKKYLNNKDLLIEIHNSKINYCSSLDDEYEMYDYIVQGKSELNDKTFELAKKARAERLAAIEYDRVISEWVGTKNKPKKADFYIDPLDLSNENVVVRVMTYEHIPLDPTRRKNPKKEAEYYAKCNFPPFKHYIRINGEWKEVLRSHWVGGFDNGYFEINHGRLTNELAKMIVMMCEKYSMKGNWRNYCVDEKTEALTQRGWLSINDITTNDIILSSENNKLKWSKIKSIYKNEYNGLMHKITNKTGIDMLITPRHKLLTDRGLVEVEYLKENDRLILLTDSEKGSDKKIYTDNFIKLLGWILSKGSYHFNNKKIIKNISIHQNIGNNTDEIRTVLNNLNYEYSESKNKSLLHFRIYKNSIDDIIKIIPDKNITMNLVLSLTKNQRELLINTMIKGDGWNRKNDNKSYCQKDRNHIDIFQALCILSGKRSNFKLRSIISFGKLTECHYINIFSKKRNVARVENLNFHNGKRNGNQFIGKGKKYHPNKPTIPYKGYIWCPETEFGTFIARRNGTVYITGNTYIDEMRSAAILQLSFAGLKFNEHLGQNPFAYFTTLINRAFTTVLNTEKRNQNIRDDMLQDNGYLPSFNRQMQEEFDGNIQYEGKIIYKKGIKNGSI